MNAEITAVIGRARFLLLDFDGPVCKVFANRPAPQVAAMLRRLLVEQGVTLPDGLLDESDPLAILRWSATLNQPVIVRRVDDALRAAEVDAVTGAEPTPYAREVIVAAHHARRGIAIVSNNSADARGTHDRLRQQTPQVSQPDHGRRHHRQHVRDRRRYRRTSPADSALDRLPVMLPVTQVGSEGCEYQQGQYSHQRHCGGDRHPPRERTGDGRRDRLHGQQAGRVQPESLTPKVVGGRRDQPLL